MSRAEGAVGPAPSLSLSLLGTKLSHQDVLSYQPWRVEIEFGIRCDTLQQKLVFYLSKGGRHLRVHGEVGIGPMS
jgi:hypothetical protein